MKNTFFVFGCVSFFIAGCSPKVTTEVVKSYPVTRAYDVRLFEAKDTLPPAAEVLGRASVEKGTESDAETMVKVETAKVGGNAFAVKEKSSSFMGPVVQDGRLHVAFSGYTFGSRPSVGRACRKSFLDGFGS